jgi:hypothetical protein
MAATSTVYKTAAEAIPVLHEALRRDDRTTAAEMIDIALTNGWDDVTRSAITYVDHHPRCPADRIEITDYTQWSRPGEPGYGVVTTHCNDCGAHRAHDTAGLPLLPQPGVAADDMPLQNAKRRTTTGRTL